MAASIGLNSLRGVAGAASSDRPEYLPVYLRTGIREEIMKNNESLLDQLRGDRCRLPIRINVDLIGDRTVISHAHVDGIPLYVPKTIPEKVEKLQGNVHVGGFTILSNEKNELLFVKKKRGNFWSVPGGLIEKGKDRTLWDAAKRELKEETGADLDDQDRPPLFAYESYIPLREPTRHNIMVFFSARYNGPELPPVKDDDIEKCAWITPALFLSTYLKNERFSSPMIRFSLDEFRRTELSALFSQHDGMEGKYNENKSRLMNDEDELLFDLWFIDQFKSGKGDRVLIDEFNSGQSDLHLISVINDALMLSRSDRVFIEE